MAWSEYRQPRAPCSYSLRCTSPRLGNGIDARRRRRNPVRREGLRGPIGRGRRQRRPWTPRIPRLEVLKPERIDVAGLDQRGSLEAPAGTEVIGSSERPQQISPGTNSARPALDRLPRLLKNSNRVLPLPWAGGSPTFRQPGPDSCRRGACLKRRRATGHVINL